MSDSNDRESKTAWKPAHRIARRQFLKATALAAGGLLAAPAVLRHIEVAQAADRTEISFASAKFFGKSTVAQVVEAFNQSQGKILVKYDELPPPSASTEVHQGLVQRLAKKDGTPDVFTQDVVWIAEFAGAGWALPLDEYVSADEAGQYFPGVLAACRWNGKLTALPWFVDSGMLYYRTDLLKEIGAGVPETWDQLVAAAQALMKAGKAKIGFSWQAKQAEVLICDLVEFVTSNGGAILGPDGKTVEITKPAAVEAVQFMYDTIAKHKISPPDVRSWDEEPSRAPFTGGDAAFLRNWSYVHPIAEDPKSSSIAGKVGVAPLPHFAKGKSAACLGGYQYGVNAATKNRDAAIEFLKWLSSPETQLRFAVELGLAPSRPGVFDSAELGKAQPFMQTLKPVFVGATARPVTPKYAQVTLALQSAVSKAVTHGNVAEALGEARRKLEQIVA
ncbi:ABC transporter substrate-binding protein [Labrys wisconsinensis]|uniref:Multiple sugar transport system substrate-binding protein n=1 Tax=Labrys wisconsinensis TaxID=425677 RepID=A0ABU0J476_9HYPH|nr:ABC transporter substrate-binding protein [Labrys wisconsinensis]MDQ0469071.1 multiple sugar transport system substrate-binding protein [Labrys wisconsinensis]